jgi:hypothetical protein
MKLNSKVPTLALTLLLLLPGSVSAYTNVDITTLALDTSIRTTDENYILPSHIAITPIFIDETNYDESFKGLFYYTIDKLGFTDIPFHYLVSGDGKVYKGNLGGDERNLTFSNAPGNFVLIGYMTNKNISNFEAKGLEATKELVTEVANNNSIKADNFVIQNLTFEKNIAETTVTLKIDSLAGGWNDDLNSIKNHARSNVKPSNKVYSAEVVEASLASDTATVGDEVSGTLKVKNTGTSTIYEASNSEIIASKESGNSLFYTSNGWLSQSQFSLMEGVDKILPGEEATFTFKVKAPLASGEIAETFVLNNLVGQRVGTNNFSLRLNVDKGGKRIIQINDTELGYLRVRSEPSTAATEVGRASSGERFILEEDAGNGLYRITLTNGTSGWVAGWLTTEI